MERRYVVRRQEIGKYCVWDAKTNKPAEADDRRYVDLLFDEAIDCAIFLNKAQNSN